ncbi:integral membrane protein-like protein [Hortaea werneckii]|nr:integral membrane protein-like protein [Hortaea werneckii]
MFGRETRDDRGASSTADGRHYSDNSNDSSEQTLTNDEPSKSVIKRATRPRFLWALLASFLLLISVVFLILVEVGDTAVGNVRSQIYFIRLNLANVVPLSYPDAQILNSIARTIGLHDFYHFGLWGFCEGYNGQGVTYCSDPKTLYWFNPVEIIQSELLAGASIALPSEINNILSLIRTVSHWMFGLFLTGACLNFLMIFLIPLSVFTRWGTAPIAFFVFFGALCTTVATVIGTVLGVVMKNVITSQNTLNIGAYLGVQMFAFMWVAAATSIIAWLIMFGQCCCCASRRDVRIGKKRGSKRAWNDSETPGISEKRPRRQGRGLFGRKKDEES